MFEGEDKNANRPLIRSIYKYLFILKTSKVAKLSKNKSDNIPSYLLPSQSIDEKGAPQIGFAESAGCHLREKQSSFSTHFDLRTRIVDLPSVKPI